MSRNCLETMRTCTFQPSAFPIKKRPFLAARNWNKRFFGRSSLQTHLFLCVKKKKKQIILGFCVPKPRSDYEARRSGQLRNKLDYLGFFNVLLKLSAWLIFFFSPIEKRLPWLGFDPTTSRSAAKRHAH